MSRGIPVLMVCNVNKSMEIMEKVFHWVREMDPIQPLTAGCWDFYTDYETVGKPGINTY